MSPVDHIGNTPIFGQDIFKGEIITTEECMMISKELLKDSVFLHDSLIKGLKAKGKRPKNLYTELDMYKMFEKMKTVETHQVYKFDDWLSYEFYNSGHVVGGTQIKLTFRLPNNNIKSLVYTSDLGSDYNLKYKPFVKPRDIIPKASMYVFEATYSNTEKCFDKSLVEKEREELKETLTKYLKSGHRVFFPSFSFGRTQELQALLHSFFANEEWFHEIPITIDGRLTNSICDTYSKILKDDELEEWNDIRTWKNFRYNKEYKGTLNILSKRECGIYISSSGFVQPKTRSCDYVKNFMGVTGDLICFVGYYGGEGTISNELVTKPVGTPIKIDGSTLIKSCDVITLKTFSSHIQQEEIFKYWSQINTNKILIHHCSEEGKKEMQEKGIEYLQSKNKTTKIVGVGKHASQFIL